MTEPVQDSGVEFAEITPPDGSARAAALDSGGAGEGVGAPPHPLGLGSVGSAAAWIAGCQGQFPPRKLSDVRVVVFAADHGVAGRGVSTRAAGSTAALVEDLAQGHGTLASCAEAADATLRIVDAGTSGGKPEFAVRAPSGAIDVEDALTEDEVRTAVRAGASVADAQVDSGADLLVAANVGVASTTPASVLVAALTGSEPVSVVGRGSGLDDEGWMRKTIAVRDALRRSRPHLADPLALLRTSGGADIAALAGFLAQAAARRTPVLLGGLTVCTAAMVAEELAPGARDWWLATCSSTEPAYSFLCEHLDLEPLLDLELSGDAEVAGVLALPLVVTAVAALREHGRVS